MTTANQGHNVSVPFNVLFLAYLLLVALSVYTMIGIVVLFVMAAVCLTPFGFFVRAARIGKAVE